LREGENYGCLSKSIARKHQANNPIDKRSQLLEHKEFQELATAMYNSFNQSGPSMDGGQPNMFNGSMPFHMQAGGFNASGQRGNSRSMDDLHSGFNPGFSGQMNPTYGSPGMNQFNGSNTLMLSPDGRNVSSKAEYIHSLRKTILSKDPKALDNDPKERLQRSMAAKNYDPFGQPGGGAPFLDSSGHVLTRKPQKWTETDELRERNQFPSPTRTNFPNYSMGPQMGMSAAGYQNPGMMQSTGSYASFLPQMGQQTLMAPGGGMINPQMAGYYNSYYANQFQGVPTRGQLHNQEVYERSQEKLDSSIKLNPQMDRLKTEYDYKEEEEQRKKTQSMELAKFLDEQVGAKQRRKNEEKKQQRLADMREEERLRRQRKELDNDWKDEERKRDMDKRAQEARETAAASVARAFETMNRAKYREGHAKRPRTPLEEAMAAERARKNRDEASKALKDKEDERRFDVNYQVDTANRLRANIDSKIYGLKDTINVQQLQLKKQVEHLIHEANEAHKENQRSQQQLLDLKNQLKKKYLDEEINQRQIYEALIHSNLEYKDFVNKKRDDFLAEANTGGGGGSNREPFKLSTEHLPTDQFKEPQTYNETIRTRSTMIPLNEEMRSLESGHRQRPSRGNVASLSMSRSTDLGRPGNKVFSMSALRSLEGKPTERFVKPTTPTLKNVYDLNNARLNYLSALDPDAHELMITYNDQLEAVARPKEKRVHFPGLEAEKKEGSKFPMTTFDLIEDYESSLKAQSVGYKYKR